MSFAGCVAVNESLPSGCDDLFRIGEKSNFDLSAEWFRLLTKTAIPDTQSPCFYLIQDEGVIKGVLPLLRVGSKGSTQQITGLTNFYTTLFRPLLSDEITVDELAAALKKLVAESGAGTLRFDAMDPEHRSFKLMENALRTAGLKPFGFFHFGNWYLQVDQMTWEDYLKTLPGKLRNTLKRLGKKFSEAEGHFKILDGRGTDFDEALDAYEKIYASSWKKPEPYPDFIPEFMRLCAQKGWLRMGVAYIDHQPVAVQFWLVLHGKACIYKVAYDEKFSAFSPGSLLTGQLMRHVIEVDRVSEVDYLIGDDIYKKQWMSNRRERWGIVAYNPRTLRGLGGWASETVKRLIKPLWLELRARARPNVAEKK